MSASIEAAIRAALETHLCATVVATTGARTDIAASVSGYVRQTGSFLADDFRVGDTVRPTGFADPRPAIVLAVSELALVVDRAVTAESAGPTVIIQAVPPAHRRFEGQPFVRPADKPWLRAALRPANSAVVAFGAGGLLRHHGGFAVEFLEPVDAGRGLARLERLASAVQRQFRPGSRIAADGVSIRLGPCRRAAVAEAAEALRLPLTIDWACEERNTP